MDNYQNIESIEPDPVAESIVELRFASNVPDRAVVLGIFYNAVKERLPTLVPLPLQQVPDALRDKDPQMRYSATHRLTGEEDDIVVLLGPRAISFHGNSASTGMYMGWQKFFSGISEIFRKVFDTGILTDVERVGVRYVSFFREVNIFDNIKLKVQPWSPVESDSAKITDRSTSFTTEVRNESSNIINRLSIQNHATLNRKDQAVAKGSVVDIDAMSLSQVLKIEKILERVRECHEAEKKLFFDLLSEDFLKSLNPTLKKG